MTLIGRLTNRLSDRMIRWVIVLSVLVFGLGSWDAVRRGLRDTRIEVAGRSAPTGEVNAAIHNIDTIKTNVVDSIKPEMRSRWIELSSRVTALEYELDSVKTALRELVDAGL